jgi:hypothetical protein
MRTHYVTTIPLDAAPLAKDLEQSASFRYSEAYSDYLIGGPWKNCMLWAPGGDSGDGVVTNYVYESRPTFTDYGNQLPYLQELITNLADLSRLNFVRLVPIANTVIIPHRDFLELGDVPDAARNAHRMHIPLVTNDDCFFSEANVVYRMRAGEVWHFDAAQIHSVASFSRLTRVHLILDFIDERPTESMVTVGGHREDEGIPADRRVKRPPVTDADRAALMRLADVLTLDTFNDVFSIVIKKHFRCDGGDGFAWDTMTEIARACVDPAVLSHTLELRRYFTLERSA